MQGIVPIVRLGDLLQSKRGLRQDEVSARTKQYGRNDIVVAADAGWLTLVVDTARDPMLWFLIGTSVLFMFLGNWVEAATLLVAVIPLIGMDLYLHHRTRASTEGLSSRLAAQATVERDGNIIQIAATDLVPGDLVILEAGQSIPADGIFLSAESIQLDESALTGEAYPVRKRAVVSLDKSVMNTPLDGEYWAYAGTRVLTGTATIRILYTGAETLYGEIVRSATFGRYERTPLQGAIANLVGVLLVAATILCLVLAWVRLRQGFGIVDAILSAVTLAVAALPEEFPVVFSFFLGVGVYRLAQRSALVRRAVVVENIGRVSCICSDKTGTLTEGQLQLTHRYPYQAISEQHLLAVAAMASRQESADPLDLAILQLLTPSTEHPIESGALLTTFPFTEDRKRETAIWQGQDKTIVVVSKGAPETIFAMCNLSAAERSAWETHVLELATNGHKVIACAERGFNTSTWPGGEPDRDFNFIGLLAFEDPVRSGVIEAIENCRAGEIHIIMVTGDHPATAGAVAREIGLGHGNPRVIEAADLENLLAENAAELKMVDVIARAIPAQKLRLVQNLQALGEVVAVTGDGVNDVPALQAADVGFAMGERGTRSAREVASIVLLDDNFRTISRAIAEGRQLFRNLKLSFAYLLMIHIPLVLTAALIPLAGYPLLYMPIHIVWLELIIHPTALLVFQELPSTERLTASTKGRRLRFFSLRQWLVIAVVGTLITVMIIGAYERSLGVGREVEHARAMTMVSLSFASAALTIILAGLTSRVSRLMVGITIVLTLLFVQIRPIAALLHLTPLHIDDLLLSIAGALGIALVATFARFRRTG